MFVLAAFAHHSCRTHTHTFENQAIRNNDSIHLKGKGMIIVNCFRLGSVMGSGESHILSLNSNEESSNLLSQAFSV